MNAQPSPDSFIENLKNIEVEQALLGAVMMRNEFYGKAANYVKAEHFYEPLHEKIWELISRLTQEGRVANPLTIFPLLPELMNFPDEKLRKYLANMIGVAAAPMNIVDFAKLIAEEYHRRRMVSIGQDCIQFASDKNLSVVQGVSEVVASLSKVDAEARSQDRVTGFGDVLDKALQGLQDEAASAATIDFFLPEITEVAGRMRPGNLVGLLSDSGGGKTSCSLQQLAHTAAQGIPCAFFSIEITAEEGALQIVSQRLKMTMDRLDRLELSEPEQNMLGNELDRARGLPLQIIEFSQCKLEDVRSTCLHQVRENGCRLVIIDHAKYIELPGKPGDNFAERVNGLYRGLKSIAKALGITIIILIQRNDNWKNRDNCQRRSKIAPFSGVKMHHWFG